MNDLYALNKYLEFYKNFKNIYPTELHLKKQNVSTSEASFLNLSIIIENKIFKTQLYDNRNAFPFSMSHLNSNIPSNIYYASWALKF